ncbi:histidinol dehydrogenase [Hypericibacter adhaerens]|jgi:histidinol dehydrogenase|uniref:Histidinol dehydrogenase n=1 Tax=Hypericibacter adhaerens TaxID=2602016 RepID=A0A5J6N4P0_9PROT|nr:histidinol dehydrogenase [Hypericibacter adhaerens]QEX23753.1 histidinol dehydrogenase [Hypericibacter adhaerens]
MPLKLDRRDPYFEMRFTELLAGKREAQQDVNDTVQAIIADVRRRGDAALVDYTRRFDRMELEAGAIRLTDAEIDGAAAQCPAAVREALQFAAERIESYHRKLLPQDLDYEDASGARLGARWRPLASVGLYVPGGAAAYPSSVLMNAVPARVAGVTRLAMVVPTPGGTLNPAVMAAARIAGIGEIHRIGGAQAVAALAYGTPTIPPVDKIVGPGNAYVAAAKRLVYGQVGIDMIAGPSEILVVADGENDPAWIAMDLLSQAEHDEAAQSILITDDAAFAGRVEAAVEAELARAPRAAIARASWASHGAIILVERLEDAVPLVDRIAPEHLELAVADPEPLSLKIRNAGAIFLGRYAPEAVGDYVAGPNHVLPTARSARFSSGLGVHDFLKRTSIVRCDAESLARLGPAAVTLARAEGLEAHARAIAIRLNLP